MKNKIEPIRIEAHYFPRFSREKKAFIKCIVNPVKMWALWDALDCIETSLDVWDLDTDKQIIKSGKEIKK